MNKLVFRTSNFHSGRVPSGRVLHHRSHSFVPEF